VAEHPNVNHWIKAAREMDNFIVVAEAYPGCPPRWPT
jgi:hypothetical protein